MPNKKPENTSHQPCPCEIEFGEGYNREIPCLCGILPGRPHTKNKPEPKDDNIIPFPIPETVEATMDALIWILDQKYRKQRAAATGTRVPSWLAELDEDAALPEYSEYKDLEFLPAFGDSVILRHILPAEQYRRHVERELLKYKYYVKLDRYEAQAAIQLGYRVYLNDDETGRIHFRHHTHLVAAMDEIHEEVLNIKIDELRMLRF